jgi:archaellum component FlaC
MPKEYIPAFASVIATILTVIANLWLGSAKNRTDQKTTDFTAEGTLRDDLLALNDRYEKRVEILEARIKDKDDLIDRKNRELDNAYKQITDQYATIAELNITVKQLKTEVEELRRELQKFERKVFYIPEGNNQ